MNTRYKATKTQLIKAVVEHSWVILKLESPKVENIMQYFLYYFKKIKTELCSI